MDYLLCIPARETNTRENCEKIHNVLARMSDTYKLRIVPESVKNKQFPCPPYYKKYRIYKQVKERDTNGEAYLEKEEEEMILNSCKTEEEQELMKGCIYAYQYSAAIVLKSFREKEKKNKMQVRPLSERTQAAKGAGSSVRGGRPGMPEKAEKSEMERGAQERPSGGEKTERSERAYRNRTADHAAEGNAERMQGRERDRLERERPARVSGAERAADKRSGNRTLPEGEKRDERPASGRRERFDRRSARRAERAETEKNESVKERTRGADVQVQKGENSEGGISSSNAKVAETSRNETQKPEPQRGENAKTDVLRSTPQEAAPETGILKNELEIAESGAEVSKPQSQKKESSNSELPKGEILKTEASDARAQDAGVSGVETSGREVKKTGTSREEALNPSGQDVKSTPSTRSNDVPAESGLPLRTHAETGGLPPFREGASQVTAQPMQRKGYAPMERKSVVPSQETDTQE